MMTRRDLGTWSMLFASNYAREHGYGQHQPASDSEPEARDLADVRVARDALAGF